MSLKIQYKRVDEAEWEALCELRDVTHARLQRQTDQLLIDVGHERGLRDIMEQKCEERVKACTAVNLMQVDRLTKQDLEIQGLRAEVRALTARLIEAEKFKPATLSASSEQPLFAKGSRS